MRCLILVFATSPIGKLTAFAAVAALATLAVHDGMLGPWQAHQTLMEAKLAAAWQVRHPGPPLPAPCEFDDVRSGVWDADVTAGNELIITSQRYGMAMFSEAGELLAFRDPEGCRPTTRWINRVLGDEDIQAIVLREQTTGCHAATWLTVLDRRGDTLEQRARFRDQDTDQCRWNGTTGTTVTRSVTMARTRGPSVELHVRERCSSTDGSCPEEIPRHACSMRGHWVTGGCLPIVAAPVWPELAP